MAGSAGTVADMAVDVLALRVAGLVRQELALAGFIALAIGALLVAFGPPPGDAAAHLYRAELVGDGVLVWDDLWYGGSYPLFSYSLLYYFPAALVGNEAVVLLAVVAAAVLFAAVAIGEWGADARWPSRAFAVCACAPLFTGTYTWAAGLAAALGALRALQVDRVAVALVCATLALGFSPLAFAFLCLALAGVAAVTRPVRGRLLVVAGGIALLAGLELAIGLLFPAEGRYGFRAQELGYALLACILGALLALRDRRARVVGAFFLVLAAACVVAFAVPSPIGSNLTRFRTFAFPLVLLVAVLVSFRPRWLAIPAVAAALFYTASPYVAVATELGDTRAASASFWEPALRFLREHAGPGYRVDVVPTFDNWEAYYVPRDGFALARGWYRQLDLARNPVLYERELTATEYRAWLRSMGVRYVLLPHVPLDRLAASQQAALLSSGESGLREVFATPDWQIFELPGATPILTGRAGATLTEVGHARIAGVVSAPGAYLLRVRYTPYWAVRDGPVCVEPGAGGMTRLVASGGGAFALEIPGAGDLAGAVFGARPSACN
jgi:hypothetical protein